MEQHSRLCDVEKEQVRVRFSANPPTNGMILSYMLQQCPKLRVHPAPGVHISMAGCTILEGVHPVCARFLSHLLLLYIGRVHGTISGCTVLWEVHPASAQNKSLISDTVTGNLSFLQMDSDPGNVSGRLCRQGQLKKYRFWEPPLRMSINRH